MKERFPQIITVSFPKTTVTDIEIKININAKFEYFSVDQTLKEFQIRIARCFQRVQEYKRITDSITFVLVDFGGAKSTNLLLVKGLDFVFTRGSTRRCKRY